MKHSIIHLGILLFAFANYANATSAASNLQSFSAVTTAQDNCQSTFTENPSGPDEETIMNPETVIARKFTKSIEEIIAENNKIIESTLPNQTAFLYIEKPIEEVISQNNQIIESDSDLQVQPLSIEKTLQDTIAEDNLIIESNIPTEVHPLGLISE